MAPSFPEIINSRLFKFIVGETVDGFSTEFRVYEEAIAQLSKPLHTLIKGNLSEAQAGCTIWKEVSKETFERFVQFAYTGDYSVPDTREWNKVAEPQKLESKIEEEKQVEEHDSLDELRRSWPTGKKTKKEKKKGKEAGVGFGGWKQRLRSSSQSQGLIRGYQQLTSTICSVPYSRRVTFTFTPASQRGISNLIGVIPTFFFPTSPYMSWEISS